MGKVIILEGPDGGGKTTLARELEKHGFLYRHEGPPPLGRDQVEYYMRSLNQAIEGPSDVVFDRLYLGELVYGPIIRGIDNLSGLEGLTLFNRLHRSKTIHQYLCLVDIATLKANYEVKKLDRNFAVVNNRDWFFYLSYFGRIDLFSRFI